MPGPLRALGLGNSLYLCRAACQVCRYAVSAWSTLIADNNSSSQPMLQPTPIACPTLAAEGTSKKPQHFLRSTLFVWPPLVVDDNKDRPNASHDALSGAIQHRTWFALHHAVPIALSLLHSAVSGFAMLSSVETRVRACGCNFLCARNWEQCGTALAGLHFGALASKRLVQQFQLRCAMLVLVCLARLRVGTHKEVVALGDAVNLQLLAKALLAAHELV